MSKGTRRSNLGGERSNTSSLVISYTPRTKRVSKAKKGKRVHPCKYPGCDKVFTRAEHRRRHEIRHNLKKLYHCTQDGCMVAFEHPQDLVRHMEKNEHDSVYSRSTEGVPYLIASETTSNTPSESASLPSTSHPDSTTKEGSNSTTSTIATIATAEWVNGQTYRPENKPTYEARFSPAELSASMSTETLPTPGDQTLYTFAGQIQDIFYYPEGSATVSSFQGVSTASEYRMGSQLPDPLQYPRGMPLQGNLSCTFPNAPFEYPVAQVPWMV